MAGIQRVPIKVDWEGKTEEVIETFTDIDDNEMSRFVVYKLIEDDLGNLEIDREVDPEIIIDWCDDKEFSYKMTCL